MRMVKICSSTIETSRIGFGTASIHHLFRTSDQQKLLNSAFDSGIRFYDTAPIYGEGIAENALGKFSQGIRNELTIVSKFGLRQHSFYSKSKYLFYLGKAATKLPVYKRTKLPRRNYDPTLLVHSVENTLTRLRSDYLDILVLHEPKYSEISDFESLIHNLQLLVDAGKILKFGISTKAFDANQFISNCPELCPYVQLWIEHGANNAITKTPDTTFGHLKSHAVKNSTPTRFDDLMRQAINLNKNGVILFSSLREKNIRATAKMTIKLDNER